MILKLLKDIFVLREREKSVFSPQVQDRTDHYKSELGNIPFDRILVASPYNQTLEEDIERFKFYSYREYAEVLTPWYRALLEKDILDPSGYVLTSVPMHWSRYLQRGFDHMHLLTQIFSRETGFLYIPLLRRTRYTKNQTNFTREKRLQNVENSFTLRSSGIQIPEKIILLDDIISSGATACEAAWVLKNAGSREIRGYFIASGKQKN